MKEGDVYIRNTTGEKYILGKDIGYLISENLLAVIGVGVYTLDEFNKYFKKENNVKGDKHRLAVEKVKQHLLEKDWSFVETQRHGTSVNVLWGEHATPMLPSLLSFKGDKKRWVWIMYKDSPCKKGSHGMEEIRTKAAFNVQERTQTPVWVYIYEASSDTVLKISLDNYKIKSQRVWVRKMNRAMWFLSREEFKGA